MCIDILKKRKQKKIIKEHENTDELIIEYSKLEKYELVKEKIKLQNEITSYSRRESNLPNTAITIMTIFLSVITLCTNIFFKRVDNLYNNINVVQDIKQKNYIISGLKEVVLRFIYSMSDNLYIFIALIISIVCVFGYYEIRGIICYYNKQPCEKKLQCVDILLENYNLIDENKNVDSFKKEELSKKQNKKNNTKKHKALR